MNIHVNILLHTYTFMLGPKKNTIKDFWCMVWQEKVEIIVMVTKLEEDGRVFKIILLILKENIKNFRKL